MEQIPEIFGCNVFGDAAMKARLPKDTYKALKKTMAEGTRLELDVANIVANAMKDWATERGATHFTHWFQPMTGVTAEKHDSFVAPSRDGGVVMEFSGKELVRGEPDASSFPSGGLRATFEARGYTVWDTTSYAFIKDGSLFIPTAFCSYSGEALDKKTPLLRSMEALSQQAVRVLHLLGNTAVKRVSSTVGGEQEYFLIDQKLFQKRPDLVICERTLFGAPPPKGQELDDHYFGSLKFRVAAFMKELDQDLWKMGIVAKTKHNEAAPSQHELAPVFTTTNLATDQNQLTMELMKSIGSKHGLSCVLHEKPFLGVNGSGKHNNWSLSTDKGVNLLEPGDTPFENAQFLVFLTAVMKAVDDYQELLRVSAASAGNDHRLGAHEAPPAIISMFLGDELTEVLEAIEHDADYTSKQKHQMDIGTTALPRFLKDTTDRNRTSPFAFTGNKFEFRMLGSSFSIAGPNIVLNSAVAEVLSQFADRLEKVDDVNIELGRLIQDTVKAHKRIVFNGNNYTDEWVTQARQRGLANLCNTVDAVPTFMLAKNVAMFQRQGVFTETEMRSRQDIMLENYCKTIRIEALTIQSLVHKEILPATLGYQLELTSLVQSKTSCHLQTHPESVLLQTLSTHAAAVYDVLHILDKALIQSDSIEDNLLLAQHYRSNVVTALEQLREHIDKLEGLVAKKYWTLPTYQELLYSVY